MLEGLQSASGICVGPRQPVQATGVCTASGQQVGHTTQPMSARARLTWFEIMLSRRACRVSVGADNDRRAALQMLHQAWVVELMHVNDPWAKRQRLPDSLLHRGTRIHQRGSVKNRHIREDIVIIVVADQNPNSHTLVGERCCTCLHVSAYSSISRPPRCHQ